MLFKYPWYSIEVFRFKKEMVSHSYFYICRIRVQLARDRRDHDRDGGDRRGGGRDGGRGGGRYDDRGGKYCFAISI